MKVYFISGLGADERVFQFLELPEVDKIFIQWVTPHKKETLSDYAIRLSDQMNWNNEVILVGISFGGIVAQEIARQRPCRKVIIISSVKSPAEFGFSLWLVRLTGIHRLVPARFLKWSNTLTADYFFSTQSKTASKLLHQIINDTDTVFLSWAIHQIMTWKPEAVLPGVVHIHGTRDRIFPVQPIKNAILVEKGGHFMIVNQSARVSTLVANELKKIRKLPNEREIPENI